MPDNPTPAPGLERALNAVMGVRGATDPAAVRPQPKTTKIDWLACGQYVTGTLAQIAFLLTALWVLDGWVAPILPESALGYAAIAFFSLISLRSRLFSPLDNTRNRNTYSKVLRPSWAPPAVAFPIIWLGISILRVIATYCVWQVTGQAFFTLPLGAFVTHLALGDTWNTIFTVEGRLGAAVPAVIVGPLASAIAVTAIYWQRSPLAGWLLVPMGLWLAVASALAIAIWQLNGKEPLMPLQ